MVPRALPQNSREYQRPLKPVHPHSSFYESREVKGIPKVTCSAKRSASQSSSYPALSFLRILKRILFPSLRLYRYRCGKGDRTENRGTCRSIIRSLSVSCEFRMSSTFSQVVNPGLASVCHKWMSPSLPVFFPDPQGHNEESGNSRRSTCMKSGRPVFNSQLHHYWLCDLE